MSLFKSREWWSTKCGVDETFGASHMCVANYEDIASGSVKQIIITGSLEGYLRIYDPQPPSETPSSSDLQLETQLALPILAIETGRFNSSEGLHVAVLHPRHLRILRVILNESIGGANSHCTVDFMYEHNLPIHGYSLNVGPSWLCVQSLTEGTLLFFENERIGMKCKLPYLYVLPSPMCYVPSTESFILCDSSWILHSYNYQCLANSSVEMQPSRQDNVQSKLMSDWELELTESVVDIQTIGLSIVVLSEGHLYCLKDNGSMLWTRKLDYHPMCCTLVTPPESSDSVVVLVCTDANTLIVYKDNVVEWNCKLPFTPLVIKTVTLQDIPGLITTLSDVGQLNVCYMGTQQVQYGFLQATQRPFSYERGLKEVQNLTQSLRSGGPKDLAPKENEVELTLKLDMNTCKEYLPESHHAVDAIRGELHILMSNNPYGRMRTSFSTEPSIKSAPADACLELNGDGEAILPVLFYVAPMVKIVASLQVEVTAIAGSSSTSKQFTLPLQLAAKLSTPVREALIKITVASNQPAESLARLFHDFNVDETMSNVIALGHLNGTIVSILVSKSTNKYRLQSDSLPALAVPIVELERRLNSHFAHSNLRLKLDSQLPLQEVWSQIESHYSAYMAMKAAMIRLSQATRQFQIIQRAFHNKILNTKATESTQGIFSALQLAHSHVTLCIDKVETLQLEFQNATHSLGASLHCIISLLNMGSDSAKKRNVALLEKALLPVEQLDIDKSWQQSAESKLNYLIKQRTHSKTSPSSTAKTNKEFNLPSFKKMFMQALDNVIKAPQP